MINGDRTPNAFWAFFEHHFFSTCVDLWTSLSTRELCIPYLNANRTATDQE